MRERTRVDDDRRATPTCSVNVFDQLAFVVRLVRLDAESKRLGGGGGEGDVVIERVRAVDVRLTLAEQIEVGSVQEQHRRCQWRRHDTARYCAAVSRYSTCNCNGLPSGTLG